MYIIGAIIKRFSQREGGEGKGLILFTHAIYPDKESALEVYDSTKLPRLASGGVWEILKLEDL